MSLNETLQDVKGLIAECINQVRGVQLTYTHFTDVTVKPPTSSVITIFARPTPSDWEHRSEFGQGIEEIVDVFTVSREAFKNSSGVVVRPTTRDHFTIVGDTAALQYDVLDVREPDQYEAVYELHCHTERSKYVRQ